MVTQHIIQHEGKRIIRDPSDCNPIHFRSAIRFIRAIEVDAEFLRERRQRKEDRWAAEKARRGTPIKYRMHRIHEYKFWM